MSASATARQSTAYSRRCTRSFNSVTFILLDDIVPGFPLSSAPSCIAGRTV
jgi:hypothetical protein